MLNDKRLIISAPFGNYLHHSGAISTLGTFTLERNPGRFMQVLRTVRHVNGGWVNKLGLRNLGIRSILPEPTALTSGLAKHSHQIVSIHGYTETEWMAILQLISSRSTQVDDQLLELNVSCPNVVDSTPDYDNTFVNYVKQFPNVIVKLPPLNYAKIFDSARRAGIKNFHCCNTIPTPIGGISGKHLLPLSLAVITEIRRLDNEITIIGGGGITRRSPYSGDIPIYHSAGADYYAIASGWFNPINVLNIGRFALTANTYKTKRVLQH